MNSSFDEFGGIIKHLEITNETVVTHNPYSTIEIGFNKNISYEIYFVDRKLQFAFGTPDIFPRPVLTLKQNADETFLYLKAIRHEKLNLPSKPCEESPDYDFSICVEKSIITRAGCQPPWRRFDMESQPICDNLTVLNRYRIENSKIIYLDKNELFGETHCLLPCSFMEYRVRLIKQH